MEEPRQERKEHPQPLVSAKPARPGAWVVGVAALLGCALLLSLGYAWVERSAAQKLASQQDQLTAALSQTRSEMDALSAKVNALSIPAAPAPTGAQASAAPATTATRRPRVVEDRRWKKLQEQLAAQQKQIDATQQNLGTTQNNLEATRTEMADNLSSAKEELGGSIAKTHDDLVALEKKGERNYYEFDLAKSKQFEHVGSITLSLRKTNTKHQYFDLAMVVNDVTLDKKHVNLYEPILIYPADSRQPLELVANLVDKDHIHGYISEPKYKQAATTASNANDAKGDGTPATTSAESPVPTKASAGASSDSGSTSNTDTSLQHRPEPQP
ncbi:MAG TPA: hypothetical protein VI455_12940 [Terriglobia bacterium]